MIDFKVYGICIGLGFFIKVKGCDCSYESCMKFVGVGFLDGRGTSIF